MSRKTIVVGAASLLISVVVLPPILMMALGAFRSGPPGQVPWTWDMRGLIDAFTSDRTWNTALNSASLAFGVAICAGLLGTVMAWLTTRTNLPGRRLVSLGVILPFFVPGAITATVWSSLANPSNGIITQLFAGIGIDVNIYGMPGMIFVETIYGLPLVFLAASAAFTNLDPALEESALANGATMKRTLARVSTPLVALSVSGMILLLFLRMLGTFEVPFLLGIPAKIEVFSSAIFQSIRFYTPPEYDFASALGLMLSAIAVILLLALYFGFRKQNAATVRGKGLGVRLVDLGKWRWVVLTGFVVYIFVGAVLPLGTLILQAFSRSGRAASLGDWTVDNFTAVLSSPDVIKTTWQTLLLGVTVGAIVAAITAIGVYLSVRGGSRLGNWLRFLLDLPLAIPGAVLGLALLWVWLPITYPVDLYGTVILLGLGYAILALPVASRVVHGGVIQLSPELEEAAWVHGSGRVRSFTRIAMPLLAPVVSVAFFFSGVLVLKDAATASMLQTTDTTTLPVLVLQASRSSTSAETAVLSCILLAVALALVAIMYILSWTLRRVR